MRLGLKIDVDTLEGFRRGVPALMEVLAAQEVKASFFLALGPDHSGRAILRIFRQRGFLEKMWRTRAPALYGFKTMCYGTLLPGPIIGAAAPHLLPQLSAAGHEVGLHGYNHVRWHDHLFNLPPLEVAREIDHGQKTYTGLLGRPAVAFAAPGWQCSLNSRVALGTRHFLYGSDTRGTTPYFPAFGDTVTSVLEIPTTLPTLDELLGANGCRPRDFTNLVLSRLVPDRPQVLTLHAEVEGGPFLDEFARLLTLGRERGVEFFRLEDWARDLLREPAGLPTSQVNSQRLPGRAGYVSCQGQTEASLS
ncbi:MAG TPA: polysaccharide deacetylase family protein [Desulfobaccales bacterium]|nr:polysaccharide deacetylase family protein [Desulfobaccales bacterium]